MTLQSLANQCAAYFGVAASTFTLNGEDMILATYNDVVREAQTKENFEGCRGKALITISGSVGTDLSTATFTAGNATAGVREIVAVTRKRPDGTFIPLDFARADIPVERDRTELEFSDNLFPYLRYPSDAQINARGTSSAVVQVGSLLFIYPVFVAVPYQQQSYEIGLECFGWLPELTAGDYTTANPNFIIQKYTRWLKWAIVYELNMIKKEWVGRIEGNISESKIEKLRDEAWHNMQVDNSYGVDANTTRSR